MTQAPVSKLVVQLGIPTTISMLVTSIYNLVDTFFVGQLNSDSATGAVGVVFSFMAVLQAFGFMFGQGAGSNISRLLGAKDSKRASVFAATGFYGSIAMGLLIFLIGSMFKTKLVYLLGSTETIFPYARDYLTNLIWAAPFVMGSFVLNNILRFEGKANLSMVGLLSGAFVNMALDPLLIFVFDMGVSGAALATGISQTISFSILLYMFISGRTQCKLGIVNISKSLADWWNIVATGFPSLIRQGMGSISSALLNWQAKIYGDAAVAAMSVVNRIMMFIFSAGLGIGQGFQPVCGYNYGAGKYSRVKEACTFTIKLAMGIIDVVALLGFIFAPGLVAIFRNDPTVIEIGTVTLRAQCLSVMIVPVMVITNMTLQSTGQKAWATFTSMLRNGIYFIPILLLFSHLFGLFGIQIAQAVAEVLSVITCAPILYNFLRKLPEDA